MRTTCTLLNRYVRLAATVTLTAAFMISSAAVKAKSQIETPEKFGRTTLQAPIRPHGRLGQDLFIAIDHRNLAEVQSLLKRGADPNSRNGLEFTPIYIAAASFQNDVVQVLLDSGAKVDARSPYGNALGFAAGSGNVGAVNMLITHGASIFAKRTDGMTSLMMAANAGSADVVQILLSHKADVQAMDTDHSTALIVAARVGSDRVVSMLLAAGAKVDHANYEGQTALMEAALNGRLEAVKILIAKGANVNLRDQRGCTPLLLTAKYGDNPEVISALMQAGANPASQDKDGHSAVSYAKARRHMGTLALLTTPNNNTGRVGPVLTARQAAQRGIHVLESSMQTFHDVTSCISCHHEGLGRIVTGLAKDSGFLVDRKLDKEQAQVINEMLTGLRPLHEGALHSPEVMKQVPLIEINEVNTSDTWWLAGMAAHKFPIGPGTQSMAMVLARQQSANGNWGLSGPRAPMQSSAFTFTALAVKALQDYAPKNAQTTDQIAKARAWLLNTPAKTSEDRASRLLGLGLCSVKGPVLAEAVSAIKSDQQSDGGWGQLPGMASDAYATGQALFALHECGDVAVSDDVYRRGVAYLLRTQDADGSWFVNKRATPANNYFDGGFPHGESQYASFNGTCWATMALIEAATLDRKAGAGKSDAKRVALRK